MKALENKGLEKIIPELKQPVLGICLGMQCAVIEFARNVLNLPEAHSTEIKEYTPDPVISLMAEQKSITNLGGTMRLGSYQCDLKKGSKAQKAYGKEEIEERHRHLGFIHAVPDPLATFVELLASVVIHLGRRVGNLVQVHITELASTGHNKRAGEAGRTNSGPNRIVA